MMKSLTVSAAEARANFSKLGAEVVRCGQPVTVFKNSKPWLVISPAATYQEKTLNSEGEAELTSKEQELLEWSDSFVEEYRDVFEALSK
jgi:prevent-host-death family protein